MKANMKPITASELEKIRKRYVGLANRIEDCVDAGLLAQHDIPRLLDVIERQQAALREITTLVSNDLYIPAPLAKAAHLAHAALIDEGEEVK